MHEIKYLANSLKSNLYFKSAYKNILADLESIGEITDKTNSEEKCSFVPREKCITSDLKLRFRNNYFDIFLKEQIYNNIFIDGIIEKNHNETIQITIKTGFKNYNFDTVYDLKLKVINTVKKYFDDVYILFDTQNETLRNQLCYDINQLESKLRKLINIYMVKKIGVYWFEDNLNQKFQNNSEINSNIYDSKYKDFKGIKTDIFNLQINDLIKMLKNTQYFNLESAWDYDIKNLIPENFNDQLRNFIKLKNFIAYNKPICRNLKQDVEISIKMLNQTLDKLNENIKFK